MTEFEEKSIALQEAKQHLESEKFEYEKSQNKRTEPWWRTFNWSLLITIAIAVGGWITTSISTSSSLRNATDQEQRKFEAELIKQALAEPSLDDKRKALLLLDSLKLVHNEEMLKALRSFTSKSDSAFAQDLPAGDAAFYEKSGFEALLNKQWQDAKANFYKADQLIPEYHSAWNIARYLGMIDTLADQKNIYKHILDSLSWRMPEEYRKRLQDASR